MHDLNRVQLIGHLGHNPAVTYTATGTARTTFSVATSPQWKDADGQVQEAMEWSLQAGRGHAGECGRFTRSRRLIRRDSRWQSQ